MDDGTPPATDLALVALLERAALNAVPAPRVAWDGPFVLRAFLGGTGRANAACSLDPSPDYGLAARIGRIEGHYARLGLPARFRCTPLDPPGLIPALRDRGYREVDGAVVMAGTVIPTAAAEAEWADGPSEDWLTVLATAEHQTAARRSEKIAAVPLLARPGAWVVLRRGGLPAAVGHAVADDGLVGLFDLATAPPFRRGGLARRVIGALVAWGEAQGRADVPVRCWLQVAPGNGAARRLYGSLGLDEAYRYRYFVNG